MRARMMKMPDQIAQVQRMNKSQLLDYVIANPHYLLYPFYKDLTEAIRRRCAELNTPSTFAGR